VPLAAQIEAIADAAGYEDTFHISLSRDGFPAFSGGGCVSARDLARFGLLFARGGRDIRGRTFANDAFLRTSLQRAAPALNPPRDWLRYSNHLMTDGRFLGHAGYGGQFLMVDTVSRTACAYLSVLENDAGYDEDYMLSVILALREVCEAVGQQ
jgi:CubicO group peptidase (beta-lactamase class C family)